MYRLTKKTISTEGGNKISVFGIQGTNVSVEDISVNGEKVLALCKKCNEKQLDEIHFFSVIEDFINEID
jgi:hypothetical protein